MFGLFTLLKSVIGLVGNNIAYGLGNALTGAIGWSITKTALMLGANRMLTPKTKFGSNSGTPNSLRSRLVNSRSSVGPRELVYGTVRKGGQVAYLEVTGGEGEFLHIVILHANHECKSLGNIFINDEEVPLTSAAEDTLRTPTSGNKYENHLQVYDHLGSENQACDTALNFVSGTIDSTDKFRGICYSYIRLTLDQEDNVWPSGLPTITRIVEGKKLYDPRTATKSVTGVTVANPPVVTSASHGYSNGDRVYISGIVGTTELNDREFRVSNKTTNTFELEGIGSTGLSSYTSGGTISKLAYSANAALVIGDFLRSDFGYGRSGTNVSTISTTEWTAAANYSDENVTLSDSSTEKRYELNGVINANEDPRKVVNDLRKNCAGFTEYIGGQWIIHVGAWRAPSVYLDESDFASGLTTQTKDDRRSSANRIKGVFANADDNYNLVEFPAVTNATYLANDNNVESYRDVEFKFITSNSRAQRVAKIMLERGRQSITHDAALNLKAMQIQAGDNFMVRFDKYGYGANGTHTGSSGASTLTDSTLSLTADSLVGLTLENTTDGSSGTITANTTDTITVSLSGGTDNDFDSGDVYRVGKNFVCLSHSLQQQSDGAMVAQMSFRESAAAVFDWNNGEETAQDSSPNTTLPDPFAITAPTLTLNSDEDHVIRKGNLLISRIKASWTTGNRNVVGYDLQWKKTAESDYTASNAIFVSHPSLCHFISDVEDAVAYNVRVRSVSGVNKSAWTEITSHTVIGKTTPPADPTNFTVNGTIESLTLKVDPHPAIDFLRYIVWRQSAATPVPDPDTDTHLYEFTGTSFVDSDISQGQTYYYFIAAEDTSGNKSGLASVVTLTPVKLHTEVLTGNYPRLVVQSEGGASWPPSTTGERSEYEKDRLELLAYRSGGADNYIFEADVTPNSEFIRLERDITSVNNTRFYATPTSVYVGQPGGPNGLCGITEDGFNYSPTSTTEFQIKDDASLGVHLDWLGDTNLYRDAANVLKTDDSLTVGTDLTVDGNLTVNDLDIRSQVSSLRANVNVSGGGIITYSSTGYLKWSYRFIVIANGYGDHFSTNGYFDINCPTSGTITGVGGASNKTATSDGIPLSTWEALYYILPIGSNNASVAANFRVCRYTSSVDVPANWLLLAVRNADTSNSQVHVINRYQLKTGTSINTSDNLHAGRGNISDGSHTTGSTGYFPGFHNRTYGHEIEAASDGSGSTLHIARETGAVLNIGADANADLVYFRNTDSSSSGVATAVGSISITSSSTAFNTSSDYRLKENEVGITDGIDRLKQLNPYRFNFKVDLGRTVDGFLAHEVQDIVPEAITGTKDGMKDEEYEISPAVYDDDAELVSEKVMGTRSVPEYQGIDQSKLVPLLTAALKQAIGKIENLESRVAELEG